MSGYLEQERDRITAEITKLEAGADAVRTLLLIVDATNVVPIAKEIRAKLDDARARLERVAEGIEKNQART